MPKESVTDRKDRVLIDITFYRKENTKNGKVWYTSSSPYRKAVELVPGVIPNEGQIYAVAIVEDTKPEDSMSGKYLVQIVTDKEKSDLTNEKEHKWSSETEIPALVISGSNNTTYADRPGHTIIALTMFDDEDLNTFIQEVSSKLATWEQEYRQQLRRLSEPEREETKNRTHELILKTYLSQFQHEPISKQLLSPMYQAMADSKPIILDEIKSIPQDICISLNHIIKRKAGDLIPDPTNLMKMVRVGAGYTFSIT